MRSLVISEPRESQKQRINASELNRATDELIEYSVSAQRTLENAPIAQSLEPPKPKKGRRTA